MTSTHAGIPAWLAAAAVFRSVRSIDEFFLLVLPPLCSLNNPLFTESPSAVWPALA